MGAGQGWWRHTCADVLSLGLVRGRARVRERRFSSGPALHVGGEGGGGGGGSGGGGGDGASTTILGNSNSKRPTATFVATDKQTDRQTHRQASWAIGNGPPLYAHMPLPVLRSHTPGRRPRTPVKTGARVRRFRGCNKAGAEAAHLRLQHGAAYFKAAPPRHRAQSRVQKAHTAAEHRGFPPRATAQHKSPRQAGSKTASRSTLLYKQKEAAHLRKHVRRPPRLPLRRVRCSCV